MRTSHHRSPAGWKRRAVVLPAALVIAATLSTFARSGPAAADPVAGGTFSVLTYNVAGLPDIISGGSPAANTGTIGERVRNYDIVNVQEDFNYHAKLYAHDNHPFRTPTSGGVPFGDGLNTLSKFPFMDFTRVDWNACNGTDCLTPKGFSMARLRLAEGVYLDVYNLHPNAHTESSDLAARRDNIRQLAHYMGDASYGNAVIVMGDTNARYTRSEDNIQELVNYNFLTDAWVQLKMGGQAPAQGAPALVCDKVNLTDDCEIVDKIFYRSSPMLKLNATRYANQKNEFLDGKGRMLSDHNPYTVNFDWSLDPSRRMSDQFGGPHGKSYNDLPFVAAGSPVATRLDLRGNKRLDRVSLTLATGTVLTHGGNGGRPSSLALAPGEHLTSAQLTIGKHDGHTRVFSARFQTDRGNSVSAGSPTSDAVTYTAPPGWQIVGFNGRSGDEVDKLGLIYAPI